MNFNLLLAVLLFSFLNPVMTVNASSKQSTQVKAKYSFKKGKKNQEAMERLAGGY